MYDVVEAVLWPGADSGGARGRRVRDVVYKSVVYKSVFNSAVYAMSYLRVSYIRKVPHEGFDVERTTRFNNM